MPFHRESKAVSDESGALKKVGAFGISVKKTQLRSDSKSDSTNTPLEEAADEEGAPYNNLPGVEISLTKKIKVRKILTYKILHLFKEQRSSKAVLFL